jgi:hypothetical protein
VHGFSRALKHHRRLRILQGANVFISETGGKPGQVDVVEAILIPSDPEAKPEFALYDPATGRRITQYPEAIRFEVEGIPAGSRDTAPGLCIACHSESKPLLALIPWTEALQSDLARARSAGQGIRPDLLIPVPDDAATRTKIQEFNNLLRDAYPAYYNDVRAWITQPLTGPPGTIFDSAIPGTGGSPHAPDHPVPGTGSGGGPYSGQPGMPFDSALPGTGGSRHAPDPATPPKGTAPDSQPHPLGPAPGFPKPPKP